MEVLGDVSADLKAKYLNFATKHQMSLPSLSDEWEAYSLSHNNVTPTNDSFDRFSNHLLTKVLKGGASGSAGTGAGAVPKKRGLNDEKDAASPYPGKIRKGDETAKVSPTTPAIAWGDRTVSSRRK